MKGEQLPDNNFDGYDFWFAEMVTTFIVSSEGHRFAGSPSGNQEEAPIEAEASQRDGDSGILFGDALREGALHIFRAVFYSG